MTKVVVLTEIDSPSRMIFSDRWTAKSASSFFSNSTKIDAAPHKTQATGLRLFIGLKDYEIRVRVGISESIFDGGWNQQHHSLSFLLPALQILTKTTFPTSLNSSSTSCMLMLESLFHPFVWSTQKNTNRKTN